MAPKARRATVVTLPGFGGAADQPVLVKLSARLSALGFRVKRCALARGPPSDGLAREVEELARAVARLRGPLVLVGRSFGGRVCARLALQRDAAAVVLLGFPVRPPGKRRPGDEAALKALRCPTLIVQGEKDPLGPLKVLRPILKANPRLSLERVAKAGHAFGRGEGAALDAAAAWIDQQLP